MKDLKKKLSESLSAYHAEADPAKAREHSLRAKALRKEIGAAIAEGALPCACGGGLPHGMEQPAGAKGDRTEYEVGCLLCPAKVRGGLLPRHAVEAWNEKFGAEPEPETGEEKPS